MYIYIYIYAFMHVHNTVKGNRTRKVFQVLLIVALIFSQGDDLEIVLCAVSRHGSALRCASPRLRAMEEVVRQALREDEMALCWASQEITRNHGSTAPPLFFFCVFQDWCGGALGKELRCSIISFDFA